MMQTARVVRVQVRQDQGPHIVWANAELEQLRADLLFGRDIHSHGQPEIRVPAREISGFARPRSLPCVDHDDTVGCLDGPGVGRQRLGP